MISPTHRLAMAKIACRADGRIKAFDYEIERKLHGETYQTVKLLLEEDFAKNEYDFSWIIGMDNANEFHKWINYEHLEKMIRFVVVPRSGITRDMKVDWYLKSPHIFLGHTESSDGRIGEISSSMVRKLFSRRRRAESRAGRENQQYRLLRLLDKNVLEYIREHNLYGQNHE
jgi:nicotinate (nicotinamide) nucleotide adenylyltransferase